MFFKNNIPKGLTTVAVEVAGMSKSGSAHFSGRWT